jgi:hypothetical protein
VRYASYAREVTEEDISSFHSFLESQPNEAQLNHFKKTSKYRDIVRHMKDDGATDADIDAMMEPVIDDPGMVRCLCLVALCT